MKYILECFDKDTELLVSEIELPDGHDERLRIIMGWTSDQLGFEGYNLNAIQLSSVAKIVGREIDYSAYDFQLSCHV